MVVCFQESESGEEHKMHLMTLRWLASSPSLLVWLLLPRLQAHIPLHVFLIIWWEHDLGNEKDDFVHGTYDIPLKKEMKTHYAQRIRVYRRWGESSSLIRASGLLGLIIEPRVWIDGTGSLKGDRLSLFGSQIEKSTYECKKTIDTSNSKAFW